MAIAALAVVLLWVLVAFVLRVVLALRWHGDSGIRLRDRPGGPVGAAADALVGVGVAGAAAAPVLALLGIDEPLAASTAWPLAVAGSLAAALGIALTLLAQIQMGASWRIGVDASEHTELVTDGLFAWVRNPIFTAMAATTIGLAGMSPNRLALTSALVLVLGLELHVRTVEEPFLLGRHGDRYAAYLASVGRFVPGIGCRRTAASDPETNPASRP